QRLHLLPRCFEAEPGHIPETPVRRKRYGLPLQSSLSGSGAHSALPRREAPLAAKNKPQEHSPESGVRFATCFHASASAAAVYSGGSRSANRPGLREAWSPRIGGD